MTDIISIAERLVSADCMVPFRTILAGGAIVLLTLFVADRTYSRRAAERVERTRRTMFVAAAMVALLVTVNLRAFSQSCDRQTVCGAGWDLNCSETNRLVFSAGQYVSVGLAGVFIAGETWRRRRSRGSPLL